MRWIEVRYKCFCMTAEASVHVHGRDGTEEIMEFMERVQRALGEDHLRRSPLCQRTTMEYAKTPVEGNVIGGAAGGTA